MTAVLVASVRAMSNALDALGFAEDDDRIVEQDGRFGFVTCSHEPDCDDMFALIAELSSSGETWEIQFRADLAPDRVLSHTLSRHRSIVAHEQQVVPHSGDGAGPRDPELPCCRDAQLPFRPSSHTRMKRTNRSWRWQKAM